MSWFDDRSRSWLGRTPRPVVRPPAPQPLRSEPGAEPYAVPFLPVRCPRCNRGDQVETYSTRLTKSPPTRYHRCHRCDGLQFRSYEVDEAAGGTLVLRRST